MFGQRRGYQFADFVSDEARKQEDAILTALERRKRRLEDAWKQNKQRDDDDGQHDRTLDAAQARQVADRAWHDRKMRLQNISRMRNVVQK